MNSFLVLLSVAAVAAQHNGPTTTTTSFASGTAAPSWHATGASWDTGLRSADWRTGRAMDGLGAITKTTKTITTTGAATGDMATGHAWADARTLTPAGRSAWTSGARLMTADDTAAAYNTDARLMATGRSAWTSDAKLMVPTGRAAAWEGSAHLYKDAQPAIEILQQEYEQPQPGSYVYSYKTANGIAAQEHAAMKSADAEAVEGGYSWVAPSGEKFAVEYVADETGFHAKGAHIPEIPLAIARSLEWNAAHPEEEDARAGQWDATAATAWKSGAATGRSAWVSEHSAAVPTWESSAKIDTARTAAWDANTARTTGAGFGGRSSWESTSTYGSALPTWNAAAKIDTASGRAASWDTKTTLPAWASAVKTGAATGRTATWDSTADLGTARTAKFTQTSLTGSGLLGTTTTGTGFGTARSAWNTDATTGLTGLGATKITKITETTGTTGTTGTGFGTTGFGAGSTLYATGRSAWNADTPATGLTGLGATKITKITETTGTTGTGFGTSGFATGRSAWNTATPTATGFTGLGATKITETSHTGTTGTGFGTSGFATGRSAWNTDTPATGFTGLGATKITKITETRTVGTPSTLTTGATFSATGHSGSAWGSDSFGANKAAWGTHASLA